MEELNTPRTGKKASHIKNYEFLEPIGKGSFGDVYKGLYKKEGEIVAIKVIDLEDAENALSQIQNELQFLIQSDDPHITKFYESFTQGNKLFIVMEYLGGGSIQRIIHERGPLEEVYLAIILKELLHGLAYLHGQKKLHRDIKCANILLSTNGDVKLTDFGVGGQITDSIKKSSLVGSPNYMAPEIINEDNYDMKADIWSLGITCIEMATGIVPYSNLSPFDAIVKIQKAEIPTLPAAFSKELRDFVNKTLTYDCNKRPSAEQLLKHPFIKSSKKKSYLTDLIDTSLYPSHQKDTPPLVLEYNVNTIVEDQQVKEIIRKQASIEIEEEEKKEQTPKSTKMELPIKGTQKITKQNAKQFISNIIDAIKKEIYKQYNGKKMERITNALHSIEEALISLNQEGTNLDKKILKDLVCLYEDALAGTV